MDNDFFERNELLSRYELVGGPREMVPYLEKVAAVCAANPTVADLARRQVRALFEDSPVPTTAVLKTWQMPEREMGEAIGAYCMMLALASVPKVVEAQGKYGFGRDKVAEVYTWFIAMIDVWARRHGGVPGIEHTRLWWSRFHADGTLFRFGNMEFLRGPVPEYVPASVRAALQPGDEIPTFHFPGGPGGLDRETMRRSFDEAMVFWKRAFGRYPKAWACNSWLFNPVWRELIPNSRIAHEVDNFEFLHTLPYDPKEPSGLFYVYATDDCDPRDYPAENSLEKAMCEVYRRGEQLVEGCVILRCEGERILWP